MKTLCIVLLLCASVSLTGCNIAGALWLESYRIKGGYYDRPSTQIPKRPATASHLVSQ